MAPFLQLCSDGDLEEVRAALARGEDVNSRDKNKVTGLMGTLFKAHNTVVEVLLQHPSLDINRSDCRGFTAVHWACLADNVTSLRMLLGDPRLTSVNTRIHCGWTPLMVAVHKGSVECVRELVRVEGVDLGTRDGKGWGLEQEARYVKCCPTLSQNPNNHPKKITLTTIVFKPKHLDFLVFRFLAFLQQLYLFCKL